MTTLAHAYGVPEAISVLVPLVVFVLLLRAGRKRAGDNGEQAPPEDAGER